MEVRMFMWEWQHVFQYGVSSLLAQVLKTLEIQLVTNTFIIGIPIFDENVNLIHFHPEECGFTSRQFETIFSIAKNNLENDPNKNLFMTAAHLHKAHQDSLYPKALKKAIESILNKHSTAQEFISFCSFPVQINNHWVITIIQLEKEGWNKEYRLTQETYKLNDYHQYRLNRSFLEAIIWVILSESQRELQSSSRGYNDSFADPERVLEDAASNLLSSIKIRVNIAGGNLFELGNAISAEHYEGSGSKGRLVICQKDNPHISIKINLKVPIRINDYRGIRKLIEISSEKMALLCDGEMVWGLGSPLDTYDPCREDLFEIKFTEHYTWELIHNERVMLRVKYRQPRLPRKRFDRDLFCDHISRFFNINEEKTLMMLVEAVDAAVEQRHGTMLVITSEAEKESKRLGAQSTVIDPITVSRDIISHVSSIDGAILISPNGLIYSFGVILDGLASKNGNPARGARFNSAIRYVDGKNDSNINCLALIVSEDGYVNLYPTLRPRINRALIDKLLEDIEKHADLSQSFDRDKAWSTIRNLDKYSFYFLNKDINRVNTAKNIVIDRMKQQMAAEMAKTGLGYIIPSFDDFTVNEEMNDEYYL